MNPAAPLRRLAFVLLAAFTCSAALAQSAASIAPPPPVPGYPVGWCIRARPEAFADAKAAGFEFVELALQDVLGLTEEEFAQRVTQLRDTGVPALSGYNPIPRELKLVGPEADLARQDEHLRHLLARAGALKLRYLIFNSGAAWRAPDDLPREQALAQLAEFGRRFATAAAAQSITVLLQPLRSNDSNLVTTVAEALQLIDAVDHPHFALMVDYSFLTIQQEDMRALLPAGSRLRHVHLANPAANRSYPMSEDESDYAAFFAVLKQIGYRGGLSVHAGTKAFAEDAPRAIAFLRRQGQALAPK